MSTPVDFTPAAAASAMIDVLERENVALASMRLETAASLLSEKQRAADTLGRMAAPADLPADTVRRLTEAARVNQTLLERALFVQGRVVALVAGAVVPRAPRYGAGGGFAVDPIVVPRALLARA